VILLLLHVSACGSRACGAAGMRRWADDSKGACFYGSVGRDDLWDAIFD